MPVRTKRLKIPFENGVVNFGTGYEIGPGLASSRRYIHKYIPQTAGVGVAITGQCWAPFEADLDSASVNLTDSVSVSCAERFENGELDGDDGYLFGGIDNLSKGTVWAENGNKVFESGYTGTITSIMHWSGLANPTTFITGPTIGSMQQTTNRVAFSPYTPTGFGLSAKHLLVYQNRLWLTYENQLFYTDVFDPNVVRQFGYTNPFVVPMKITGIERVGISDVDIGAQSHLFIGGATQTWILDGAPGAGNEVLRRYTHQLGVLQEAHMVSTNLGIVFFGTNRQLYLVPPGAAGDPIPIGQQIRNALKTGEVMLAWRFPYLIVFVTSLASPLYADFSEGKLKWWGSTYPNSDSVAQVSGACSNRWPSHDYFWATYNHSLGLGMYIKKVQDPAIAPETSENLQVWKTGYIFDAGHDVVLRKAHFIVRKTTVAKTFTFMVTDDRGVEWTQTFTVPSGTGVQIEKVQIPVRGSNGIRGDFFFVQVSCPRARASGDEGLAGIQIWEIEYDVVERLRV